LRPHPRLPAVVRPAHVAFVVDDHHQPASREFGDSRFVENVIGCDDRREMEGARYSR
jgi:hypothetical protein